MGRLSVRQSFSFSTFVIIPNEDESSADSLRLTASQFSSINTYDLPIAPEGPSLCAQLLQIVQQVSTGLLHHQPTVFFSSFSPSPPFPVAKKNHFRCSKLLNFFEIPQRLAAQLRTFRLATEKERRNTKTAALRFVDVDECRFASAVFLHLCSSGELIDGCFGFGVFLPLGFVGGRSVD